MTAKHRPHSEPSASTKGTRKAHAPSARCTLRGGDPILRGRTRGVGHAGLSSLPGGLVA